MRLARPACAAVGRPAARSGSRASRDRVDRLLDAMTCEAREKAQCLSSISAPGTANTPATVSALRDRNSPE